MTIQTEQRAIDAFRARLEPELTNEDLERRSVNAVRICLDALAAGNVELAAKAFDRMVERWAQRDERQPAVPAWMWQKRHAAVCAIEQESPDGWERQWQVWQQFYRTMGVLDGMSADAAEDYAYGRVQNMRAMEG